MRIAVGAVAQETNTFFDRPSTDEHIVYARGPQVLGPQEREAMARAGHEVVPLLRAGVSGAGPIAADCFRGILAEFIALLKRSLPLDAIFLPLHGAMWVPGIGSGEEALVKAIRDVVGPEVFLAGTLDLHGNLSAEFTRRCDCLTSLRTAPHRDERETRQRGVALLLRCLRERLRPVSELIKLPLLLPGEAAMTDYEPAKSFYARLPALERQPGILAASLLIGCAWTDGPDTGVSVLIYGTDRDAVRREARRLAQEVWSARDQFQIVPPPHRPETVPGTETATPAEPPDPDRRHRRRGSGPPLLDGRDRRRGRPFPGRQARPGACPALARSRPGGAVDGGGRRSAAASPGHDRRD